MVVGVIKDTFGKKGQLIWSTRLLVCCDKCKKKEWETSWHYRELRDCDCCKTCRELSEEHKRKISNSEIGKKVGKKNPFYGRHHTEETKRKIGESRKNLSEETRRKLGANKGREFSEESRKKMGDSHRGKVISEEQKMKISAANKGTKHSKESVERSRQANIGRHPSAETRQKMSVSRKGRKHSEAAKEKMRVAQSRRKFPYSNTSIEIRLQQLLNEQRISFETQKAICGVPDIFIEPNICIFADGDYWHANPIKYKSEDCVGKRRKAKEVWSHDAEITERLTKEGYVVIRFWEHEINSDIELCLRVIKEKICKEQS